MESSQTTILACVATESRLPALLRERGAGFVWAAHRLDDVTQAAPRRPDVVVLEAGVPGLSALDVRRALYATAEGGVGVPLVVLVKERPTPEERVAGVRAGAWEFVRYAGPRDLDELLLKIETFAHSKRTIDAAVAEGLADRETGLLNMPGLVRRGRELVTLMARERAPVACVVLDVRAPGEARSPGSVVARTSRLSDVVGALDQRRFVVLAPDTDEAGAVKLAERYAAALHAAAAAQDVAGLELRAGYHVVGNMGYQPTDSVELLRRATAALESGEPDSARPWVRRFDVSPA